MSGFEISVQSIQLEREPYESEVRAEVRRREEETRIASKRLRKGPGYMDANVLECLTELEARSNEGIEEIRSLNEEVRQIRMAVLAVQEKYMQGLQYTSSADVVLKEQYGTSKVRAIQSSGECEENDNKKDNNEKGVENEGVDVVEGRGGTLCTGDMELASESVENAAALLQEHGSGWPKSTYMEVVVNDKNMKQVGHRST